MFRDALECHLSTQRCHKLSLYHIYNIIYIEQITATPKQMAAGLIESVFLKSVDISISENKRFYQFEGNICASNFDAGRSK